MHTPSLAMRDLRRCCLMGAFAALLATGTGDLRAQSAADSLAISRELGANLPPDTRAIIRSWACGSPERPCASAEADSVPDPFIGEVARVSGLRLAARGERALPCTWGYDPPRADAGYSVSIADIRWSDSPASAFVLVGNSCDNPPGYLHDIFSRMDEYAFVREDGRWRLLWKRVRAIT